MFATALEPFEPVSSDMLDLWNKRNIHQRARVGDSDGKMACGPAGPDMEQPARRETSQALHQPTGSGYSYLEGDPELETRRWRTAATGSIEQGRLKDQGLMRSAAQCAPWEQNGQGNRATAPTHGRQSQGAHACHQLAGPQRAWIH